MVRTAVQFDVAEFQLHADLDLEQPFDVEVSATFEHESGYDIDGVPGYYDGDGTWVIRFSPTREGTWTATTIASEEPLDGVSLDPFECVENENDHIHGRVETDPLEPRRFRFADGTECVPLGFEIDWLFAYHQAEPEACYRTVDRLRERGFNYLVLLKRLAQCV